MPAFIDLAYKRFGRLLVLYRVADTTPGRPRWQCLCDCGKLHIVASQPLSLGEVQSCGCLRREAAQKQGKSNAGPKNGMYGKYKERHPNWNHSLTKEERVIGRNIPGYSEWRTAVYERDNYTCQHCGKKASGKLIAHHIEGYDKHPKLRTQINNGITLCQTCHENFHHQYGKGNNTEEQWITYHTKK